MPGGGKVKYLLTGDLEITKKRIPDLSEVFYGPGGILEAVRREYIEGIIFGGDIWREYNAETVKFMTTLIQDLLSEVRNVNLLVGNHDREIGLNKISATFEGWDRSIHIIDTPQIWGGIAYLPAPDRAAFGATRAQEGPRERDAALSLALEAALELLVSQAGAHIENTPLVYHATLDAALFGGVKIASGLTWTVPATEVSRFGMGLGFHIHSPEDYPAERFGTEIHTIGSPVPDTFGVSGDAFRVGILNTSGETSPVFRSVLVPRVLRRIEVDLRREGDRIVIGDTDIFIPDLRDPADTLAFWISEAWDIVEGDRVALKINASLPESDLALLPDPIEIRGSSAFEETGASLTEVIIRKIPTGLIKSRLDEAARGGRLSPEDLLRKWAEVSGYEGSKTIETAAWILQGDGEFEDWTSAGLSGFNPIRTRVENFRQYERAEIDWTSLSGRVSITGVNASGKSNIAKATVFGLYKRTPASPGLDDELRRGEKKGYVEVEFEAGGKRYLVRRVLERNTKGRVSCKSELFEIFGSDQMGDGPTVYDQAPVCETGRDIDKKISELVGSYDYVVSTFFASEAQIDALTRATPAEMRRYVIEALSLDSFEAFRERAGKKGRGLDERSRKNEAALEEVASLLEKRREDLSNYPNAEDLELRKLILEAQIGEFERIKAENDEEAGRNKAILTGLEEKKKAAEEISAEREAAGSRYTAAESKIKGLSPLGDPPPDVSGLSLPDLASERAGVEKKREARDALRRSLDRIALEVTGNGRQIEEKKRSLDLTLDEIEKLKKEDDEGGQGIPCAGMRLEGHSYLEMYQKCPAFEAWGNEDRIVALRDNAQARRGEIRELEEVGKTLEMERSDKARGLKEAEGIVLDLEEALAKNEETLSGYVEAGKARNEWETARILRQEAEAELEEAAGALKLCQVSEEAVEDLGGKIKTIRDVIGSGAKLASQVLGKISDARADIARMEGDLQAIERTKEDISGLSGRSDTLENYISALRGEEKAWILLETAFHSTGIPFLLLEEALPAIAYETNRLLSSTDLSVSIRSVRENKDGAKRDDIEVRYLDPRGEFPLCVSSGAQEKLLGLCLRFALAKVGGDFWGTPPRVFIQDEGFGAFHPDRYDQVRDIIRLIAEEFDRFIYITHVIPLAEDADIRFQTRILDDTLSELRRVL